MKILPLIRTIREIRGRILRLKSVSILQFDFSVVNPEYPVQVADTPDSSFAGNQVFATEELDFRQERC